MARIRNGKRKPSDRIVTGFVAATLNFCLVFQSATGFALTTSICPTQESKLFNIVGYDTIGRGAGQYSIGGSMFTKVGQGQTSWSLDDLKIVDGGDDPYACTIQFLQASSPRTDNDKYYYYVPRELAGDAAGWYNKLTDQPVSAAEKIIPAGNGFLVNFPVATAKLVYSGEVQTGTDGKIYFSRSAAGSYAFLCNPVPSEVLLKNVMIVDGGDDPYACTVQFLQSGSPRTDNDRYYYYVSRELAGDAAGWYGKLTDLPAPANEKIGAGEGVLVTFPVAAAKLVFDSPIK